MMRWIRGKRNYLAGAVALAVLVPLAFASSAAASIEIKASGLSPDFSQGQYNYTVSCQSSLTLRVRAKGHTEARIGAGGWFSRQAKTRSVKLSEGQAIDVAKRSGRRHKSYWIRCLPENFPAFTYKRYAKPSAPLYIVSPLPSDTTLNRAFIFDRRGVPVWWSSPQVGAQDATVLSDGTIAWTHYLGGGFGSDPTVGFDFHHANGHRYKTLRAVGSPTDNHELQQTPDGNYMLITYRTRTGVDTSAYGGSANATVLDGVVQKISPKGKLLWQWSTADHIGLAETGRWWGVISGAPVYDIVHMNAVQPLKGGDILISLRHTDAVYRINGKTGAVEWKLGGTSTPKSLTVKGDPHPDYPFGGQHDVRLVNGTVTVHDNGTFLMPARSPRAARFRISGKTATMVDQQTDPLAPSSVCCGSARYNAPDDSWLMSWGGDPIVTEFNKANKRTFLLKFGGTLFSYRAQAIRGEVSRRQLVAGMNAQVAPKK